MLLRTLALSLLIAASPLQEASVSWKPELKQTESGYSVVLTARIPSGYYIHTMEDEYIGTSLELIETEDFDLVGSPRENFTPSTYKGTTVATVKYVISQDVKVLTPGARISGSVSWSACTGDMCGMPEDFEFTVSAPSDAATPAAKPSSQSSAGSGKSNVWSLILEAILWGFAMLLTPCVFPMVPMTVSFFLKQSGSPAKGRFNAAMYGLFIVLLYTVPICLIIGITYLAGGEAVTADIFNWLSTHWLPNIIFFIIFMVFAASFFGAFEIVLPSAWTTKADKNSSRGGLTGIFFLALTLVLVSFSCTGPIVGTVLIKSTEGEFWTPLVTMLAFSVAFALPFTFLAFFPSLLSKLPKSGGWLSSVKVVLGFIEVALGLKFLSTADQTYHWHLLDREVYLAIWIVCFALLGMYLLGKLRFKNDEPLRYISVWRLALAIADLAFVVYLIPGMWGAPLKALSGYLPPLETQDFVIGGEAPSARIIKEVEDPQTVELPHGLRGYTSLEAGEKAAALQGKRVFVDISGYGCVNCREMEARVWSDPQVLKKLQEDFVIVVLYMDDKTGLPREQWVTTPSGRVLKDVGRVNSQLVKDLFGVNSQPNYLILDTDGKVLKGPRGYNLDIPGFVSFLSE